MPSFTHTTIPGYTLELTIEDETPDEVSECLRRLTMGLHARARITRLSREPEHAVVLLNVPDWRRLDHFLRLAWRVLRATRQNT